MDKSYDVIVVGARCAGSPTAMMLARAGLRVLLVDRARFPSDTISSHILHPPAAAALARWGLLDRLVATGCPPITTYAYDFGPLTITGQPGTEDAPLAYCPRRTVLDKLLVDAAAEAGAEVREGYRVDEVLRDGERAVGIRGHDQAGSESVERAAVVVGADGWHSRIAESFQPELYRERPILLAAYYSYWSDLPMDGRLEVYIRPRRGFGAAPTHDGLTLVIGGWPYDEFEANRSDVEGSFLAMIGLVPRFAERLRAATRREHFKAAAQPNYFRKPYGPGWALVGDAGYLKDSITAQGIQDAFRDAELLARALVEHLVERRPFEAAMEAYQRARDEAALPMYEHTCQLATLAPPPPEAAALFAAIARNPASSDEFARMNAGAISPAVFFAPDNVARLVAAGGAS